MADNTQLNTGSGGDLYASDEITGGVANGAKAQRIKVGFGVDTSYTDVAAAAGQGLPVAPLPSGILTLQASQTSGVTNATTSRTTTTGLDAYTDLDILIRITGAGAVTGVLQLFLQDSRDGGTTWDDLVSSPAFVFGASALDYNFAISGKQSTTRPQGQASQQEALAAGSVRQGPFGERLRVREKVSGVSGSPTGVTYTITAVAKR